MGLYNSGKRGGIIMETVAKSTITPTQNRRLHHLLHRMGFMEEKSDLVIEATHGRTYHSSEMTFLEALDLINQLEDLCKRGVRLYRKGGREALDKKRKGLIRAVFEWYKRQNKEVSMEYVLATICRAGKVSHINELTAAQLTRLYAEFIRKQQVQEVSRKEYFEVSNN